MKKLPTFNEKMPPVGEWVVCFNADPPNSIEMRCGQVLRSMYPKHIKPLVLVFGGDEISLSQMLDWKWSTLKDTIEVLKKI